MVADMTTSQLMEYWSCTRQAVQQIMKRHGRKKMFRIGYNGESIYSAEDIKYVNRRKDDSYRR